MQCCCFIGYRIGDIEPKACAEIGNSSRPDVSVVALENALDDGQADAAPGQVGLVVQALEDAEKSLVIGHVEANAIVIKIKDFPVIGLISSETNPGRVVRSGKLPRVLKEMLERKLEQGAIAEGREVGHDGDFDVSVGIELGHFGDHTLREVAEVDDGVLHDVARYAGQLQEAVEQTSHLIAGLNDVPKITSGLFVELLTERIHEHS